MTDDNPFDDADVQAAANAPAGAGGSNAYGADDGNVVDKFVSKEKQREIAVDIGKSAATSAVDNAKDEARQDYNQSMETQEASHKRPETPQFCIKCWNWFPLKYFACIGGCLLIALPVIDFVLISKMDIVIAILFIYLIVFGVIVVFIEAPTFKPTRWMQLKVFFWFKFLSRLWGRSWFYLFASFLCYVGFTDKGAFSVSAIAGFYLSAIAILGCIFSRRSARLQNRIYEFVAAGAELDESDELLGRFMRKFDELDPEASGKIGQKELLKLAVQANRMPTNSELQALQNFLDESCNGYVSKEDWMKIWLHYSNRMRFL